MRFTTLAIAAMGLVAPTMAMAKNAPYSEAAPSVQPASVNPAGQALICRYYTYEGTVIRRRDCRTAHQWERLRLDTQRDVSNFQIRSLRQ